MPADSLTDLLRCRFESMDRIRGEEYFRSSHVETLQVEDGLLMASVRGSGSQTYQIEIELDEGFPGGVGDMVCNCPRFHDADCCKHLWAVLCVLEELKADVSAERSTDVQDDPELEELSSLVRMAGHEVVDGRVYLKNGTEQLPVAGSGSSSRLANRSPAPELLEPRQSRRMEPLAHLNAPSSPGLSSPGLSSPTSEMAAPPSWARMLAAIEGRAARMRSLQDEPDVPADVQPLYLLDLSGQVPECPTVEVLLRQTGDGQAGWHTRVAVSQSRLHAIVDQLDAPDARIIGELLDSGEAANFLQLLDTARYGRSDRHFGYRFRDEYARFSLDQSISPYLIRELVATGRLFWCAHRSAQSEPFRVERFAAGQLQARLVLEESSDNRILMKLQIVAEEQVVPSQQVVWAWENGLVLLPGLIGEIQPAKLPWLFHFMQQGEQSIEPDQLDGLLHSLLAVKDAPELVLPAAWGIVEEVGQPRPVLRLNWPARLPRDLKNLKLDVTPLFRYGERTAAREDATTRFFDGVAKKIVRRNQTAEVLAMARLWETAVLEAPGDHRFCVDYPAVATLPDRLAKVGWSVEAAGRPLLPPRFVSLSVNSEADWFDLGGGVAYADQIVPLPVLLQAVRRKENFVVLDDGSHGLLPTEWLDRFGRVLELADPSGDELRFGRAQALLLDGLLAEQEQATRVDVDAGFRRFRKQLSSFEGVQAAKEPPGFKGELREYQREGLGWLGFLQQFGFGGCLADDMGLGKTIQVLALLEQRRTRRLKKNEVRKPSLVVVPKSLVFNWVEEAARFAPKLAVVDFTGLARKEKASQLATADLILTTYGTLRKDLETILAMEFDYAILDEAQAIKNPATDSARACYLIRADHRLSMTGTPVENHLGDLWSQFRFLNPGLLGQSQAFAGFHRSDCPPEALQQLSRAIRPFLLRRTKQEVLKELPAKSEQTLFCEMSPKQARQYNELRDHYRTKLSRTVREMGINRAKIHVLEALLRLRQTACDGRLVNPQQGARGAKLDLLLDQLEEIIGEGHKALVFSQFTGLLSLLQQDLKKRGVRFEYLDGQTHDRKSPVRRFQNDPECPLFLISLKAGGHGLNLTAADYVFILDPWWNPAAEAQAIDRAHRIGQVRHVSAYRLIARGTVEEKILELQKSKRKLADAIVSADNSLIRSLTAEDLQILLE